MNKKISFETININVDDIFKLNINKNVTKKIIIGSKRPIKIYYPEHCKTNFILTNGFWKKELSNKNYLENNSSKYICKSSNKYDNFKRIIDKSILDNLE